MSKVLTVYGLAGFAKAIAENDRPTEATVRDLFNFYADDIYHEWTNEDIARQALTMVESDSGSLSLEDIEDYRDYLVEFLISSPDFNIEAVGERFDDANDASEIGVTWVTVEWAVEEVHTHSKLAEIIAKGITEAKNNDDNAE